MSTTARTAPVKPARFCAHCGYNVAGLPVGSRCPECGRLPPPPAQTASAAGGAQVEELRRTRIALERMERRQRFSWGRVLALLAVVLIIVAVVLL